MKVLVVGGGIAGLSAVLSLHAMGIEAVVVDSVTEMRPLGVGINLLPHATAELIELGLGEQLATTAIPTAEVVHFDRWGNEIWRELRGMAAGHRWPQYSVHRGELQDMLLRSVRERLGPSAVRTGLRFVSATQNEDGVHSIFHDRVRDTTVEFDSGVLIGADGLHSAVRAGLYPHEPEPSWNGIRMWRGTTMARPFGSGATMIFGGSNHAAKFVAYPISQAARQRGRALINWVAEVRLPKIGDAVASWDHRGRLEDVLPHYDGWELAGLDVGSVIAGSERILEYPMVDRDPVPRWTFGRITLMGDAAHPMYPVGSNGGSQAILDARALAIALADAADPAAGLAAYEAARLAPANETVLANRDIPMDRILRLVAERAPRGFDRIEDVVTPDELRVIGDGYRRTSSAL
ncbi:flavin-dependent oxidoreductase [Nocardia mexicana]|uniref:2-polyprenyl-6-methoxyphenol hydroxylase-like FAD-dependent oxidoreductase n=1 Tax=Nocardia mexicana TaxID=279262 RepID=A0A370H1H5_9NOCA|nr:flavin-dependent oxidoreductase [Nocardia mexicana]RDI49409.1 2-polyprenyl-6-methoxyphenol hydroxylase-like FAD-dependent oxidoreductase [Nocardia mexicana]